MDSDEVAPQPICASFDDELLSVADQPRNALHMAEERHGAAAFRLGRRIAYRRSDVEQWLQRQIEETARGGVV